MSHSLESPKDLAIRSGWPERRIRALIAAHKLRHIRIGGSLFLPEGALEEYLRINMVHPEDAHLSGVSA